MRRKLNRNEIRKLTASINWDEQPLGRISDAKIAKKLGIHNDDIVRYRRKKRGITPQNEHAQLCIRGMARSASIDWDNQPFGRVSDGELAKLLGCQRATVMRHREKRGIEPYEKSMKRIERFIVNVDEQTYDALFKVVRKNKTTVSTYVWKLLRETFNIK